MLRFYIIAMYTMAIMVRGFLKYKSKLKNNLGKYIFIYIPNVKFMVVCQ